jgi:MHS family proline/betaine transporter-like MFS transporter
MSVGGELPGGLVFAIEHADPHYTGFVGSSVEAGYGAGTALGALAGFIYSLPGMPEWSWRLFFIFGFMLSLIGLYVRKYTTETPEFNDIKKTTEKAPLLKGLKEHPEIFVLTIMISSFAGVVIFLHEVFFPFFLKQLPFMTENFARLCGTISCWCFVILMPVFGLYSDLTYRLKPMRIGAILIIISMGSMFAYAHLLNRYSVLLLQITVGCSIAMFFSPLETFIAELFNKKIRCSCFAFCQNIGIGIFGGATPMIATLIASKTDGHLILACVVSCWGVLALVAMQQLQKGIIGK